MEFFSTMFSTPFFCLTLWKTPGFLFLFILLYVADQVFHILGESGLVRLFALDFADRRHDRGVVAGKDRADLLIGLFQTLPQDVHAGVPRKHNICRPLFAEDGLARNVVAVAYLVKRLLDLVVLRLFLRHKIRDCRACEVERDLLALKELHGAQLFDAALNAADVAAQPLRQIFDNIFGERKLVFLRLLADDCHAQLGVRRLNVGGNSPFQARADAFLEVLHLADLPVAGDDDLLLCLVKHVEGVKKLVLCGVLARDELNIVYEQNVRRAVFLAELLGRAVFNGFDQVVGEFLAADVDNAQIRIPLEKTVDDRVHQVRLAETALAVDEQRVVVDLVARGDGIACSIGKLVCIADNEVFKGEVGKPLRVVVVSGIGGDQPDVILQAFFLLFFLGDRFLFDVFRKQALCLGIVVELFVRDDVYLDLKAEIIVEVLLQNINVFVFDDVAFEIDRYGQKRQLVGKTDQLNTAEPKLLRRVGKYLSERLIDVLPYRRKLCK